MGEFNNCRSIFLVRHCHPQINEGICLGKKDIPLSERGKMEAKILADYLMPKNIEHVYSSPLKRARETAAIISHKEIIVSDNFSELDMGIWDGLSFEQIKKTYPKEYEDRGKDLENYIVKGGESMSQCRERAMGQLNKVLDESDGNILIVTHAGVIRTIISSLANIRIKDTFDYKINYGSITMINYDGKYRLVKIGTSSGVSS